MEYVQTYSRYYRIKKKERCLQTSVNNDDDDKQLFVHLENVSDVMEKIRNFIPSQQGEKFFGICGKWKKKQLMRLN